MGIPPFPPPCPRMTAVYYSYVIHVQYGVTGKKEVSLIPQSLILAKQEDGCTSSSASEAISRKYVHNINSFSPTKHAAPHLMRPPGTNKATPSSLLVL